MSLKSGALMVIASSGAWVLALVVVVMVAFSMMIEDGAVAAAGRKPLRLSHSIVRRAIRNHHR
jgi:hypothetical protein